jgi:uncharacterized protein (DUF1800 family)
MPNVANLVRALFDGKLKASTAPTTTLQTRMGNAKSVFSYPDQALQEVPASEQTFTFNGTLSPYAGPWTAIEATHLLRRTGFGVKQADLDSVLSMDMEAAVEQILDVPATLPAPPINNYNGPDFTDPNVPSGETWINQPYEGDAEGYRIESWRGWWYQQMMDQGTSIRERLTLFWHNHFATQTEIVFWGRAAYQMNQTLRAGALGNFKNLVKQVTLDPMMLLYLNGFLNSKLDPDENYARELQELFTIGKDNPDHYTEDDVVAAARVLTGWKVNFDTCANYQWPIDHDFSDKQFSAFYGNQVIQGNGNLEIELDALLDMIFEKNEVAEYLCRKLYRWFVYYKIDATTEQNIIQPLAAIFRQNNYEIKPVIETLLKSEHFFEAAQSGCHIKTPTDIVIGNLRTYNTTIPGTTLYDNFVMKYYLTYFMSEMKMLPGDPPGVAGWQAYRQIPLYYRIWINGDTLRIRNLFTDIMAGYYLETDNDRLYFDLPAFVSQFPDVANPVALVSRVTTLLFPKQLSVSKQFVLKSILLSGLPNDSYWTTAWQDYLNNPTDPMAFEVVNSRLLAMHAYMMRLPEFQLS